MEFQSPWREQCEMILYWYWASSEDNDGSRAHGWIRDRGNLKMDRDQTLALGPGIDRPQLMTYEHTFTLHYNKSVNLLKLFKDNLYF